MGGLRLSPREAAVVCMLLAPVLLTSVFLSLSNAYSPHRWGALRMASWEPSPPSPLANLASPTREEQTTPQPTLKSASKPAVTRSPSGKEKQQKQGDGGQNHDDDQKKPSDDGNGEDMEDDKEAADEDHTYGQDDNGDDNDDEMDDDESDANYDHDAMATEKTKLPPHVSLKPTLTEAERKKDKRENDVLAQFLKVLDEGKQKYPVVVGGIGDSGTRGVRALLRSFGVHMLYYNSHVNRQGDSRIYEGKYAVYDPVTNTWSDRIARELYKYGVHRARTIQYNETYFNRRAWEFGRQFIGASMWRTLTISSWFRRQQNRTLDFWGMKHPRTILNLPFFASALGTRMKFVHVFRDPKEVASGDNQQTFLGECRRYYGRKWCPNTFEKRVDFWADVNWDAYQVARKKLDDDSYMVVRIEDLVNGDVECIERLARFVGLPEDRIQQYMSKALAAVTPFKESYFGGHVSSATRNQLANAIKLSPEKTRFVADKFGYSAQNFALTRPCQELPRASD